MSVYSDVAKYKFYDDFSYSGEEWNIYCHVEDIILMEEGLNFFAAKIINTDNVSLSILMRELSAEYSDDYETMSDLLGYMIQTYHDLRCQSDCSNSARWTGIFENYFEPSDIEAMTQILVSHMERHQIPAQ